MFDERPIGDLIANQIGGGTPSRQVPAYWNGPIPWASVKDFTNGDSVISSTQESITVQGLIASASSLIPAGTLMICTRMAVGRSAFAPMDVAINQDVKALQPAVGTSRDYLLRLLQFVRPRAEAAAVGSTVKGIRVQDFLSILAPIAPAVEQSCIAEILTALDTTIGQTEAIIVKLKLVKQGMLHDLLTRGIGANGELRAPQNKAPHLYKDSPLGWIPMEWEVLPLCELGDVLRGKFTHRPRNDPAFYGGEFPFIQTGDVAHAAGGYLTEFSQTLSERGVAVSQEFPAGTIAITIAANIADTAILSIPMYFPDSVVGMVVSDAINVQFVELSIRRAKPKLDARAPQSAQKNINLQDLRPLLIAVPSKHEQDVIASRAEAIQVRIQAEEKIVEKLIREKSGLMDDLLTGRVRVTPLLETLGA